MKPRVLITGANGFIGKALVEYLAKSDVDVVACVRSRDSIICPESVVVEDGFEVTQIDQIRRVFSKHKNVTHVVHLAALMEFNPSDSTKEKMDLINVQGTKNLLTVINEVNSQLQRDKIKFIFSSSQEAIGPNKSLCDESTPCRPTNHYGKNKVEAENVIKQFELIPSIILRVTGVTGKGDRYAAFEFIQAISMGIMLVYPGSCSGTSSFVYVQDVIELITQLICDHDVWLSGNKCEVYIVGPKDVLNFKESIDVLCDFNEQEETILSLSSVVV
ncbi:N-acetyl-alpha-D-glucosaminyl-diphospho-ditrans [Acrasis kona]|uniref:N-acetyl-alpha-D-glucosaminyl-diphospho-ditrans n=1 Tax=Acrasis kona TaxID=1008807 RepID=A0AAW2Z406_9EUKA